MNFDNYNNKFMCLIVLKCMASLCVIPIVLIIVISTLGSLIPEQDAIYWPHYEETPCLDVWFEGMKDGLLNNFFIKLEKDCS